MVVQAAISVKPGRQVEQVGHVLSDARPHVPAQQFWYRGLVLESVLDPGHTGVPHGVEHTRVRPRVCGPPHVPLQEPHGPHVDHAGGTGQQTLVVSRLEPEQKTPPQVVGGVSQSRVRVMLPHVRSYEPQGPQTPLTAR